jgi:heat shock protein HtpX
MVEKSGRFWELERVNRRRTVWLVAAVILVPALIGLGYGLAFDFRFHNLRFSDGRLSGMPIFGPLFLALAGVSAVAHMIRTNFAGADRVLGALGAHPISSDEPKNQAVIDVVHEMALAARMTEPRIDLIDDHSPNAFAVGRDPEHSVICVTQGLLDQMDREELQGVIGHEMAHIRNSDIRLTTWVTAMFGGGVLHFIFDKREILARIISGMLSREREYLADASAVEFTRNPKALIRALEHIAKTESPLRCASPGTAQLFIVDPFERAGAATTYKEYINEITRIRLQPGKTQADRDEEARKFALNGCVSNSSHPPLGERIERLQALVGAAPGAAEASGVTADQLKAKFYESATFVRKLARTGPEGETRFIDVQSTPRDPIEQKLYEFNLASSGFLVESSPQSAGHPEQPGSGGRLKASEGVDSSLPPSMTADPTGAEGTAPLDSAAQEELHREALAKLLAPVAASMQSKAPASQPPAAERSGRSGGLYLFWFVIAFSAAAIVASFTIK